MVGCISLKMKPLLLWAIPVIISLSYASKFSRHGTLLLRIIYHLIMGILGGAVGLMVIHLLWSTPRPTDFIIHLALTLSFSTAIAISTNYTHNMNFIFKMFWNVMSCCVFSTSVIVLFWFHALIRTNQELTNEEVMLVSLYMLMQSIVLGIGIAISNEIGRLREIKRHKLRLASGYGIPWPVKEPSRPSHEPSPKS